MDCDHGVIRDRGNRFGHCRIVCNSASGRMPIGLIHCILLTSAEPLQRSWRSEAVAADVLKMQLHALSAVRYLLSFVPIREELVKLGLRMADSLSYRVTCSRLPVDPTDMWSERALADMWPENHTDLGMGSRGKPANDDQRYCKYGEARTELSHG